MGNIFAINFKSNNNDSNKNSTYKKPKGKGRGGSVVNVSKNSYFAKDFNNNKYPDTKNSYPYMNNKSNKSGNNNISSLPSKSSNNNITFGDMRGYNSKNNVTKGTNQNSYKMIDQEVNNKSNDSNNPTNFTSPSNWNGRPEEKKGDQGVEFNYGYANKNIIENFNPQNGVFDTYSKLTNNNNIYNNNSISNYYGNNEYTFPSSVENNYNNIDNRFYNNFYKNSENNKYNQYNQYNNRGHNNYNNYEQNKNNCYPTGVALNDYNKNYIDKNDYSQEMNTQNYQKNQIYCGKKGLNNNGNNCYINSTIQCLKHCFIFTKYIIKESLFSYGVFGAYKSLIESMCQPNFSKLNPLKLKKEMAKYNNIYSDHEQHDSTIFFNDLLNALNKELCEETSFDGDEDEISSDEDFEIKYIQHISKSKVNEYFSFYIKELTVFNCGEKMVDYEEYYYLDLPIFNEYNQKLSSLDEALENYIEKSYDYGKNTLICNKHQKKEKSYYRNIFLTLPEILVISLKRVVKGQHVDHFIEYGQSLDMSKYVQNIFKQSTQYELFAEILHIGTAYGGHKIAVCKNFNTNNWYRFNDDKVEIENNIIFPNAFLLFYKRM